MTLDELLGVIGPHLGDFGEAYYLGLGVAEQAVNVTATLLAGADHGHADAVVGRIFTLGRPNVGGEDEGSGGKARPFEEAASGSVLFHFLSERGFSFVGKSKMRVSSGS